MVRDRGPAPAGRAPASAIVAVSLVAVLAGGALFLSGWTLGRQTALTPGTPSGEAELFQPFWDTYRAVTDRYAGGDVDRKALVEGAIKGMIGALDDPYSQYLTSEEFKAEPPGHLRRVRGDRGDDRHGGRERGLVELHRPRAGVPDGHRRPAQGRAGREGRPPAGRRRHARSTASPSTA